MPAAKKAIESEKAPEPKKATKRASLKLSHPYDIVDAGSKLVFVFSFDDRDPIRIPIHKSLMDRPDAAQVIERALAAAMRGSHYKPTKKAED